MKKLIPIILLAFILVSCSKNNIKNKQTEIQTKEVSATLTIADIFPYKENIKLDYISSNGSDFNYTYYVDYIKGNRLQFRLMNPTDSSIYVVENSGGELKMIASQENCTYHDDLTSMQNTKPEIMLKEPLVKGTSWTLYNGEKRYISNDNVQIATNAGNFIAIEVTTESSTGKTLEYYAPNMGLIKKIFTNADKSIITTVDSVRENEQLTESVKFYYPDSHVEGIYYYNRQLNIKTNYDIKSYFEDNFKKVPNDKIIPIFTSNVKINNLYLNKSEERVYIDLSNEFTKMNFGSSGEGLVLNSLVNTLCDYYNVDKVYLTVDGSPYESGHILMSANESMYAKFENVKELK